MNYSTVPFMTGYACDLFPHIRWNETERKSHIRHLKYFSEDSLIDLAQNAHCLFKTKTGHYSRYLYWSALEKLSPLSLKIVAQNASTLFPKDMKESIRKGTTESLRKLSAKCLECVIQTIPTLFEDDSYRTVYARILSALEDFPEEGIFLSDRIEAFFKALSDNKEKLCVKMWMGERLYMIQALGHLSRRSFDVLIENIETFFTPTLECHTLINLVWAITKLSEESLEKIGQRASPFFRAGMKSKDFSRLFTAVDDISENALGVLKDNAHLTEDTTIEDILRMLEAFAELSEESLEKIGQRASPFFRAGIKSKDFSRLFTAVDDISENALGVLKDNAHLTEDTTIEDILRMLEVFAELSEESLEKIGQRASPFFRADMKGKDFSRLFTAVDDISDESYDVMMENISIFFTKDIEYFLWAIESFAGVPKDSLRAVFNHIYRFLPKGVAEFDRIQMLTTLVSLSKTGPLKEPLDRVEKVISEHKKTLFTSMGDLTADNEASVITALLNIPREFVRPIVKRAPEFRTPNMNTNDFNRILSSLENLPETGSINESIDAFKEVLSQNYSIFFPENMDGFYHSMILKCLIPKTPQFIENIARLLPIFSKKDITAGDLYRLINKLAKNSNEISGAIIKNSKIFTQMSFKKRLDLLDVTRELPQRVTVSLYENFDTFFENDMEWRLRRYLISLLKDLPEEIALAIIQHSSVIFKKEFVEWERTYIIERLGKTSPEFIDIIANIVREFFADDLDRHQWRISIKELAKLPQDSLTFLHKSIDTLVTERMDKEDIVSDIITPLACAFIQLADESSREQYIKTLTKVIRETQANTLDKEWETDEENMLLSNLAKLPLASLMFLDDKMDVFFTKEMTLYGKVEIVFALKDVTFEQMREISEKISPALTVNERVKLIRGYTN